MISQAIHVLDHGYVRLIETWGQGDSQGAEAGIIEAARQSTQGSFRGWERDRRLLRYMFEHNHATPFEFAGAVLEVRAPIFIFRQWHRHRLFSVNEHSARYGALPAKWYIPTLERVMSGAEATANKQAAGSGGMTREVAQECIDRLSFRCREFERDYREMLEVGVPRELARLGMPVNWYSQMRVSCNLRGWLHFLALRMDPHAQWEIRQFANAVAVLFEAEFPETMALFNERVAPEPVAPTPAEVQQRTSDSFQRVIEKIRVYKANNPSGQGLGAPDDNTDREQVQKLGADPRATSDAVKARQAPSARPDLPTEAVRSFMDGDLPTFGEE